MGFLTLIVMNELNQTVTPTSKSSPSPFRPHGNVHRCDQLVRAHHHVRLLLCQLLFALPRHYQPDQAAHHNHADRPAQLHSRAVRGHSAVRGVLHQLRARRQLCGQYRAVFALLLQGLSVQAQGERRDQQQWMQKWDKQGWNCERCREDLMNGEK
jgi:hypothetical protein